MSKETTISYDSFVWAENDMNDIEAARAEGGAIWESKRLENLRTRIKAHHFAVQDERCCYCQRNLMAEYKLVIDIEHILPKSSFSELMFEISNLSVACKRCNMNIKRQRVDFVVDYIAAKADYKFSHLYYFIHPNFDNRREHLNRVECLGYDLKLVKYIITKDSDKGEYTYKYFRLSEFEIESFDQAQGMTSDANTEAVEFFRLQMTIIKDKLIT